MARIRMIKPEFWSDATVARLDIFARLFYVALWNFADDEGRGRAIARELLGFAFPLDDDIGVADIESALCALESHCRIILYEADGVRHYQIVHWDEHQKINRPTASRLPPPPGFTVSRNGSGNSTHEAVTDASLSTHEAVTDASRVVVSRQEAVVSREAAGGRRQVGDSVSAQCVATDTSCPALPLDASVQSALPPPSVTLGLISEPDVGDLLASGWTMPEILFGCQILRERAARGKRARNAKGLLHVAVLPDVRKGKRPNGNGAPAARASPAKRAPPEALVPAPPGFIQAQRAALNGKTGEGGT